MNENVVIGFGNAMGRISKTLLEQKYHIIERINVKTSVSRPSLMAKKFEEIDLGIYKGLISKKRNQMLLQSFIGLNEAQEEDNFLKLKQDAIQQVDIIKDELNTIIYLTGNSKCSKFMAETKTTEREAELYLREFNGNVAEAINAYNERAAIISSFAEKHKIPVAQAKSIMVENNYNAYIFD